MAFGKFAAQLAELRENAAAVGPRYEDDLDDMIIDAAIEGEAFMKENAPWEDDTGAAREGLFTVADIEGDRKEIVFSHGVGYGIWLEINYSGRYEIIMPSVKAIGEQLMRSTEGSLNVQRRRLVGSPSEAVRAEQAAREEG